MDKCVESWVFFLIIVLLCLLVCLFFLRCPILHTVKEGVRRVIFLKSKWIVENIAQHRCWAICTAALILFAMGVLIVCLVKSIWLFDLLIIIFGLLVAIVGLSDAIGVERKADPRLILPFGFVAATAILYASTLVESVVIRQLLEQESSDELRTVVLTLYSIGLVIYMSIKNSNYSMRFNDSSCKEPNMSENIGEIVIKPGAVPWPHELRTAEALAASGYRVEFLVQSEGRGMKSADVTIEGNSWEIKSPLSDKISNIEKTLRKALHQSENVIYDSQRVKRLNDSQIEKELSRLAYKMHSLNSLLMVDKKRNVVKIK